MTTFDEILTMTKMLYPDGRAFKFFEGNDMHTLHRALAHSEARAWDDAKAIQDSILPDNDGFTADDATDWERRLGIASGGSAVPLADRKLAILRKMVHPGTIKARQSYSYIEGQLRAAGFDVHVYENIFDDGMGGTVSKSPDEILGIVSTGTASMSDVTNMGMFNMGQQYSNMIVNYLERDKDALFQVADNYRNTFFIAGDAVDEFASVDANRETEFRQLILLLKPLHLCGYLFVNYV